MDVALHPDYAKNGWIYLSYAEPGTSGALHDRDRPRPRARREVGRPGDPLQGPARALLGRQHALRLALPVRQGGPPLLLDRRPRPPGRRPGPRRVRTARSTASTDDGRIPKDNPFVGTPGALGSIWSYGNRNVQGLAWHPVTGDLWATEHGPARRRRAEPHRARPQLRLAGHHLRHQLRRHADHRQDRDAGHGPAGRAVDAVASPPARSRSTPATSFPGWKNDLFLTALAFQELRRLVLEGNKVVQQEVLIKNSGRVRDVLDGTRRLPLRRVQRSRPHRAPRARGRSGALTDRPHGGFLDHQHRGAPRPGRFARRSRGFRRRAHAGPEGPLGPVGHLPDRRGLRLRPRRPSSRSCRSSRRTRARSALPPASLKAALEAYFAAQKDLARLFSYASMQSDQDTRVAAALGRAAGGAAAHQRLLHPHRVARPRGPGTPRGNGEEVPRRRSRASLPIASSWRSSSASGPTP